ncbi:MAG: dTMP kinase [Clostridia bacterium]|jgi:dTMP kinase|nr:dTMP kinase [Clostridia bacterium]
MKKGLFITIEGGEACGKSTQVTKLKEYFKEKFNENEYLFVREPGGTPLAEEIRKLLLNYTEDKPLPMTELLLFCAARCQISNNKIIPALNEGKIVIADRFYDSTLAYQGEARGIMNKSELLQLTHLIIGELKPDLTFYLKLAPEEAFKRKSKCNEALDRIESEGLEFHQAVARGYDFVAEVEKDRFCIIDAALSPDEIFDIIKKEIEERLGK